MPPLSRSPVTTLQPLILDFLAPSWTRASLASLHRHSQTISPTPKRRHASTTTSSPSAESTKPYGQLTESQKAYLSSSLRINQAGELAAVNIYSAQTPPLTKSHPHLRPLMRHMYDQEAGHLSTFNTLLAKHRIRPSALSPLWVVAAKTLGWGTAMLGREAAMACTEAVETEIGGHYNDQVRVLLAWKNEMEDRGERFPEELGELLEDVRRIRDEELEHLDHAVENDSQLAKGWPVLTAVIRGGCRAAIKVCERV